MIPDLDTQKKQFVEEATLKHAAAAAVLLDPEASAEDKDKANKEMLDMRERGEQFRNMISLQEHIEALSEQEQEAIQKQEVSKYGAEWKNGGEYYRAIAAADIAKQYDPRLKAVNANDEIVEAKDLSSLVGADGGYLLGSDMVSGIQQEIIHQSVVMPRANVIPMSGRTLEITRLDQEGTASDGSNQFGGMISYWEGEAQKIRRSQPRFLKDTLTAHKIAVITGVPNETLADSMAGMSIETQLNGPNGFSGVLAYQMDRAFLRGSGNQQPDGVIDSPMALTVSRASGSDINYEDIGKFLSATLPGKNYVWVIHVNARGNLLQLQTASQTDILLWGDPVNNIPSRLLGYPIEWTGIVPGLGNRGSMGIYDFGYYNIGQRQMITVDANMSIQWEEDMTLFRAMARVDGQTQMKAPFTLDDGTAQVSPFVVSTN